MKFSFCSCLKRDRATYNISSATIYYKDAKSQSPTVILPTLRFLSDVPVVSYESDYERIPDSSGDGEISTMNVAQTSTRPTQYGNYAKIPSTRPQQQSSDDYAALYATVNKQRNTNHGTGPNNNTDKNSTIRKNLSSTLITVNSSQALSSLNSNSNGLIHSPQHPPLPPPLPPMPLQVQANTRLNNHNNTSSHRPYYDEIIVRESLQGRNRQLRIDNEQNQQEQLLQENYYSSLNSEHGTTNSSDLYAEIGNINTPDIVYSSPQYDHYSRPLNDNTLVDDSSGPYATVNEEQITTGRIYQDIDSSIF